MNAPDFLIIPTIVRRSKKLTPSDWVVYATVYWFEKMKDGKCTASNETIAEVAGVGARAVRGALDRLEEAGFIQRVFKDDQRKVRHEVRCLVRYAVAAHESPVDPNQTALPGIPVNRAETPGEFARRFFEGGEEAMKETLEQMLLHSHGRGREQIMGEMQKFIVYWTEPNKSGTKQKWQLQQTFDVKRRLYTWLSRAGKWQGAGTARAGAGREI